MRLGKLLVQAAAVCIALAVSAYGYVAYRAYQVSAYERSTLERFQFPSLATALQTLASAPSMRCTEIHSDFNSASQVAFYHSGDKSRIDFTDVTRQDTQHWIALGGELYLWSDASEYVLHIDEVSVESLHELADILPPLFVDAECSAWWRADQTAFRVPSDKPIIRYDELR